MSDPTPRQDDKMADTRRSVELRQIECRQCDWASGEPLEDTETVYTAWQEHFDATGHRHSWNYTIARSAATTDTIATLRGRLRGRKQT
jgi:hypothetical protein